MINPFKEVNWTPGPDEKRKFALSLIIGFPVLAVLFFLAGRVTTGAWQPSFPLKLGGFGFLTGTVLWLVPSIAQPFYVTWYFLACCIGIIMANILLLGLYYGVVTGTGWMLRVIGRCPISKRPDRSARTYWQDAEQQAYLERYFRQF